jgi:small subunit ribosomal protein S1
MFNGQNEEKDLNKSIETMEEETKQEETEEETEEKTETKKAAVKEKPEQETEVEVESAAKPEAPASEKKKDNDMMSLMDEYFSKFKAGEIVKGQVVNVDEREILVDIGYKSESAISTREFSTENIPEVGTEIKVYIESVEDGSGRLKLSKKKADFCLIEFYSIAFSGNSEIYYIIKFFCIHFISFIKIKWMPS